jgi:hypothetical protein
VDAYFSFLVDTPLRTVTHRAQTQSIRHPPSSQLVSSILTPPQAYDQPSNLPNLPKATHQTLAPPAQYPLAPESLSPAAPPGSQIPTHPLVAHPNILRNQSSSLTHHLYTYLTSTNTYRHNSRSQDGKPSFRMCGLVFDTIFCPRTRATIPALYLPSSLCHALLLRPR